MAHIHISTKKLADLDAIIPGLAKVWKAIKAEIGSSIRCPKGVTLTDVPAEFYLSDGECGQRYALDLTTMSLGEKSLSVSSGEWRIHGGARNEESVDAVPNAAAVVNLAWQEYYRCASMTVQVAPGAIPSRLLA